MARRRVRPWQKLADRFVGIPAVALLSLGRKRSLSDLAAVQRIGLMKTAAVGDTLLLAGLIDDVRRTYPAARLTFITGVDNASAIEFLRCPDDEHITVSPKQPIAAVRALRRARLDVLVDFGSWPRYDATLAALSGARFR